MTPYLWGKKLGLEELKRTLKDSGLEKFIFRVAISTKVNEKYEKKEMEMDGEELKKIIAEMIEPLKENEVVEGKITVETMYAFAFLKTSDKVLKAEMIRKKPQKVDMTWQEFLKLFELQFKGKHYIIVEHTDRAYITTSDTYPIIPQKVKWFYVGLKDKEVFWRHETVANDIYPTMLNWLDATPLSYV